jgi:hypothetical protein
MDKQILNHLLTESLEYTALLYFKSRRDKCFALKGQYMPARRNAAGNGKHDQRPVRATYFEIHFII